MQRLSVSPAIATKSAVDDICVPLVENCPAFLRGIIVCKNAVHHSCDRPRYKETAAPLIAIQRILSSIIIKQGTADQEASPVASKHGAATLGAISSEYAAVESQNAAARVSECRAGAGVVLLEPAIAHGQFACNASDSTSVAV